MAWRTVSARLRPEVEEEKLLLGIWRNENALKLFLYIVCLVITEYIPNCHNYC